MESPDNFTHIKIVTPNIDESTGNEVMMSTVSGALIELLGDSNVEWINLYSENPSRLERWIWTRIRENKLRASRYARQEMRELLGLAGIELRRVLVSLAGEVAQPILRGSGLLTEGMHQSYIRLIERINSRSILFSTNFQAFEVSNEQLIFICIGIDLCPEYKVGEASQRFRKNVHVITSCSRSGEGFRRIGVPDDRIHYIGLPISSRLAYVVELRMTRQKSEGGLGKVLVQLGGTGPEIDVALTVISKLKNDGQEVIVLCGDHTETSIEFREKVLELGIPGENVYGGTSSASRYDFLVKLNEVLHNPDIRTVVARPNQWSIMAGALGLRFIVLPGFQPFEERAYYEIGALYPNAVYWDRYFEQGRYAFYDWSNDHDLLYCIPDNLKNVINDIHKVRKE